MRKSRFLRVKCYVFALNRFITGYDCFAHRAWSPLGPSHIKWISWTLSKHWKQAICHNYSDTLFSHFLRKNIIRFSPYVFPIGRIDVKNRLGYSPKLYIIQIKKILKIFENKIFTIFWCFIQDEKIPFFASKTCYFFALNRYITGQYG